RTAHSARGLRAIANAKILGSYHEGPTSVSSGSPQVTRIDILLARFHASKSARGVGNVGLELRVWVAPLPHGPWLAVGHASSPNAYHAPYRRMRATPPAQRVRSNASRRC